MPEGNRSEDDVQIILYLLLRSATTPLVDSDSYHPTLLPLAISKVYYHLMLGAQ